MERRGDEQAELERCAVAKLKAAFDLEPRDALSGVSPLVRLWRYPSFEPYRSWLICTSLPELNVIAQTAKVRVANSIDQLTKVRQVIWDRPHDMERLIDPMVGLRCGFGSEPQALKVRDVVLTSAGLLEWFQKGKSLPMPSWQHEGSAGCDGETFGFESYGFLGRLCVEWWCDGPLDWKPFTDWVAEGRSLLESAFR